MQPSPVRPGETRSPFAVAKHVCGVMNTHAGGPTLCSNAFVTCAKIAYACSRSPAVNSSS